MSKFRLILGLVALLILITGCDVFKTEKDVLLLNSVTNLQHQIEKDEWDKALSNINKFENLYEERKWKLQLLGELEDYKEVELEIAALKESVKEQEKLDAKIGLAQIKHRLHVIYNL